jgi:hypothetical protein
MGVVGVRDEVQYRDGKHRDRSAEVEVREDLGQRQQFGGTAQVAPRDDRHARLGQEGVAVRHHDRVEVDVDDPRRRVDLGGDLVHDGLVRQPHPEVEELVDARVAGQEPYRAPDELPGRGGRVPNLGQHGEHLLGGVSVRLEGPPAAQIMVVHARDVRRARIQPLGRSPRGLSLHGETLTSADISVLSQPESRPTRYPVT